MKFNLLHVASIIAISQAILMAVVFAQGTPRARGTYSDKSGSPQDQNGKISSILLSVILIIFAAITASSLLLSTMPLVKNPFYQKFIFLTENLSFLIGPAFYFYVRSLLDENFSLPLNHYAHSIPFLFSELLAVIIAARTPGLIVWTYPGRIYFSAAVLIQNLVYLLFVLKILRMHGLSLGSLLVYIESSRLSWVRFFMVGYVALWSIQLQLFVGWDVLNKPQWCPYTMSLWFLTAFLFFNVMVYLGLKKPEYFQHSRKYQHSILQKSDKETYRQRLTEILENEKIYLDPSLSLMSVARKLDIAPCYVSQIINESFRQNFRDFINRYRIEESKRLLAQQNQHLNILGIAHDAGFNSKSSFNTAFKKHTGITPKEFRRNSSED